MADDEPKALVPVDDAVHDEPTHPGGIAGPPGAPNVLTVPVNGDPERKAFTATELSSALAAPKVVPATAETRNVYTGTVMARFELLHKAHFQVFDEGYEFVDIDENFYHALLSAQAPVAWKQ